MKSNSAGKVYYVISVLGIIMVSQFFVIASINIIRGYSIQSYLPNYTFLVGYLILVFIASRFKKVQSVLLSVLSIFLIITILPNLFVGSISDALKLYNAGYYNEALAAAETITDTWYRRIGNNYEEPVAWDIIARVNCQKGDFEKAINIYEMIIDYYPDDGQAKLAANSIRKMQNALDTVSYYPDKLPELYYKEYNLPEVGVPEVAPVYQEYFALLSVASAYQYGLNCDMKALEMCQKAAGLDIPEENKVNALNMISKLKVQ